MKLSNTLHFVLQDRINGIDVGPKHVSLKLLGEFQQHVVDFLRGDTRDIDPAEIIISIKEGSLELVAHDLPAKSAIWEDLQALASSASLHEIDPKRASVIEKWQANIQEHHTRKYTVMNQNATVKVVVDTTSNYVKVAEPWVITEKTVYGKILEWGGKYKASVKLELDDGTTLSVAARHELLGKEETNRLYKMALLHIVAEENLNSGKLRDARLIAFETYNPSYDEAEFQKLVDQGTAAWSDVPDATEWLENLRGNTA